MTRRLRLVLAERALTRLNPNPATPPSPVGHALRPLGVAGAVASAGVRDELRAREHTRPSGNVTPIRRKGALATSDRPSA